MADDLQLALALADLADSITLPRFRAADLRVATKPDLTPVSEADLAVERALRERLADERPDDVVLGEEEGHAEGARRWIVDPIDGTRNYVRGVPVFASLIALEVDGEVELGVVSAPALARRWWARRGGGAFRDGEPIRVSGVARLEDAVVSDEQAWPGAWHSRNFGDFLHHVLVAEGGVDIAVDPVAAIWDCAALKPILEEAGGRFTSTGGVPTHDGGSALSTNASLHGGAIEFLHSR